MDFSAYNTQIVCLIDAIISKAHENDKYNSEQDCEGLRPLTEYTFFSRFMQNYNWWSVDEFSHFDLKTYGEGLMKIHTSLICAKTKIALFKDHRNYNEIFLLEEQKK